MITRELRQLGADLFQGQAHALSEDNESDPSQHRPPEAAVSRAGALRVDQATILIEPESGGGDAAPSRHLADRQEIRHR